MGDETRELAVITKFWRSLLCRFKLHRSLNVIQTFGAAQHIGCPDCGEQMGIHHGMRAVIPWDPELAQLYKDMGYDVDAATARWQAWRRERKL